MLCAVVLAAYWPSLHGSLVYEDLHWWSEIWTPVTLRPTFDLAHWSLSLNAWLGGGFHLTNVGIHCVNGWLVFVLARQLLLREWETSRDRHLLGLGIVGRDHVLRSQLLYEEARRQVAMPALLAAAVFLLHPIQTEAVAYLTGRWELVSTMLVLTACVAPSPVAIVAGVLAMTTKTSAVVALPLVWLVRDGEFDWFSPMIFLLPLLVVVGGAFYADRFGRVPYLFMSPYSPIEYAARQAVALWRMLALVVVPWGQTVDHDWIHVPIWAVATAIPALLGAAVEIVRRRRAQPFLWLAACWILCCVAPRFVVRTPEFLSEHQMYLPMVGVSLLVGSWVKS